MLKAILWLISQLTRGRIAKVNQLLSSPFVQSFIEVLERKDPNARSLIELYAFYYVSRDEKFCDEVYRKWTKTTDDQTRLIAMADWARFKQAAKSAATFDEALRTWLEGLGELPISAQN